MTTINPLHHFKQLSRELKILFFAYLINRMGTMVLPFLTLYLVHYLHFSPSIAGLLFGLFGIGALITDITWKWFLEKHNKIHIMVASLFISGIAILFIPLFTSVTSIAIFILIWAMANEAFRPASMATISELSSLEQRKIAFSFNRLAINLGMSLGPAIGGLIINKHFPALFVINGISTLLTGLILFLALWPKKTMDETISETQTTDVSNIHPFKDKKLFYLLLATLPVSMIFMQHEATLSLYMVRDLHINVFYYGLLFTINTLIIVALEVSLNAATAHWQERISITLGSLLITLGFTALLFSFNFLSIALTVVIWTFGEMFLFPAQSTYISKIASPEKQGSYMALYSGGFNLSLVIGPWLGMYVFETWGSSTLWIACFIAGIISTCMFWRMKEA